KAAHTVPEQMAVREGPHTYGIQSTDFTGLRTPGQSLTSSEAPAVHCAMPRPPNLEKAPINLVYRILWIFWGDDAAYWERLEMAGTLALIYSTSIPYVTFASKQHSYLRSGYLSCLTILAVSKITETLTRHPDASNNAISFRRDCVWLGLLALAPAIYTRLHTRDTPPSLAIDLVRLTGWNVLGALCSLARIPERFGVVGNWQLSLYTMHFLLVLSNITYAQRVWDFIVQ
ncbi:hypothetical protein LV156_009095, partial [Aspergillus fumigatus]